ncbi:MAG: putative integral rane protein [Acidimicrobiaceae bacterium]|nr:putative integral rane protein [Acidimicrobiaceae bacterium]
MSFALKSLAAKREPKRKETTSARRCRISLVAAGTLFSVAVFLWTQLSMLAYPGWRWASFRIFGSGDQLSYFAEVVNGAHGNFSASEPFTETGTNNDPHLYYQILGVIAHLTGITSADAWNIGGVVLQIVLVICISLGAAIMTRRWWAAFFGAVPFLIGTLSFTSYSWYTLMQSHAVLWGAFAVMFPLNSESASLAIAGSLFVIFLALTISRPDQRTLLISGTVVGAGVGLLANFHTYGFLTAFFFAIYCLSAYAIAIRRRWLPALLTVALIVILFQVGPPFASSVGRLATLVLGLVPALPGVVIAIMRWRWRVVAPLLASALTASPQVVGTWLALQSGNAFLKYREASSVALGVTWKDALLSSAPLLLPLLMILVAGFHRRNALWIAYPSGVVIAWMLIAKNDVWGTNQEPYRLWIDGFALTAFTVIPIALDVALNYLTPRATRVARPSRSWRVVVGIFAIATLSVGGVSSIDWFRFYKSQEDQTLSLYTPVDNAMVAVASAVTNRDLILTDPCTDGATFKAVTGARVAMFSPGLAWPARLAQISAVQTSLANGKLTSAELGAAHIGWLVTQTACATDWAKEDSTLLTKVTVSRYGPSSQDVLTLWRMRTSS